MQRPVHEYKNKSLIFNTMEALFSYVSDDKGEFSDIIWADPSFQPLIDILNTHLFDFKKPEIREIPISLIPVVADKPDAPKEITICFSGGKDSAACAYYYKKQGYKVHLYHATGINKAYPDEKYAAQALAKYLGCDLFIDKIYLAGSHPYIEHPMKNYIIANGAIHYCINTNKVPRIAFGNFNQSKLEENAFEICAGDCIDMWEAYIPIIRRVIPSFELEIPLRTVEDTFNIVSEDWKLFELAISCMSPYRFRKRWRHDKQQKFNVQIFPNRCGSCWKCCMEWMWLADTGKAFKNLAYYLDCFRILEKTAIKELGELPESPQFVWDSYMFYPIEQSMGKEGILSCSYGGKLKYYEGT